MGTTASKPAGAEAQVPPTKIASSLDKKGPDPAACPLGFGQKQTGEDASPQATATTAGSDAGASKCPIDHATGRGDAHANTTAAPAAAAAAAATAGAPALGSTGGASSCPVKKEDRSRTAKYLHPHKYNVYSQRVDKDGADSSKQTSSKLAALRGSLDPSNNMPVNPNQLPAAGQQVPLSTERVRSTIPKGGEETTWTYPSPQMFWNSLSRKGKVEDTKEDNMDVVVAIHNNMNEFTWRKILQWEKLRTGAGNDEEGMEGSEPRLLRFLGRPDDTTPKALAKMMLGHPLPFDRHDWVVDKGGDERRYVIDYYHDEGVEDVDEMPGLHSEGVVNSIKVDVRPALDGFRDLADRLVQMPLARLTGRNDFSPLPLWPSSTMVARETWAQVRTKKRSTAGGAPTSAPAQQEQESAPTPTPTDATATTGTKLPPSRPTASPSKSSKSSGDREARAVARMKRKCAAPLKSLIAAEGAGDAENAQTFALKLEYCTARYLCRKEAKAYKEALMYAGSAGAIAGDAHTYWAERAVEARLEDMRAALAGFTARQHGRRREGGEGGAPSSLSSSSPSPPAASS